MSHAADALLMDHALDLALLGEGTTSPNPLVGCVVTNGGEIVGRGYHKVAGGPHAEVFALREAGERARGGDLYVTLEPCSHQGRTPPCAEAVIRSGVRRVVVAMEDPNPLVSGRGVSLLRQAGIEVVTGVKEGRARRINEGFCHSIVTGRAFVHLKMAATLDGRIATSTGDSRWITSPQSRQKVHEMRRRCGAVMVGIETALRDDPMLTVRLGEEGEARVLRVILDRNLRIDGNLKMLTPAEAPSTLIYCGEQKDPSRMEELKSLGAEVEEVALDAAGYLDLGAVLASLLKRGRMEVLLEGGATTARSFLDRGLVGRFHFFYAPKILGGYDSKGMFGGIGPELISSAVPLKEMEVTGVGPDIYITGLPHREKVGA